MKLCGHKQEVIQTLPSTLTSTWKTMTWLLLLLSLSNGEKALKVRVPSFWGDDKVLMDSTDSVTLDWFLEPGNTTVSWVRCYQGNGRNPLNHFFSYHFISEDRYLGGPLKGRTEICPFVYRDDAPFAIRILLKGPTKSDNGCFTCEIDVGGSDPLEAKLMLRVYRQGTDEISTVSGDVYNSDSTSGNMTKGGDSEQWDPEVRVASSEWTNLEIGFLCCIGALVLVIGVIASVFASEKLKTYSR